MAQLVARFRGMEEVGGSIPPGSTRVPDNDPDRLVRCGVGEFGRPRWAHNPEIAGSNLASATGV